MVDSHSPAAVPQRSAIPDLTQIELAAINTVRKHGPTSRTSLAEALGISRASMTALAGSLLDAGILTEVGIGRSDGGRPPQLLDINSEYGLIGAIDLGATSMDVALANFKGELLGRIAEPSDVHQGPDIILGRASQHLNTLLDKRNAHPANVLGIGVGVPGPVSFPAGLLISPPLMPSWENYPIKDFLKRSFPNAHPVVDNDVNIMALGEQKEGAGRGLANFLFVKIGTGIGCGIITHGEVYRGSDGCAGDIGHICIDYNGPVCHCGNRGCLEFMAAGPAIAERAKQVVAEGQSAILAQRFEANQGELSSRDVGDAAAAGDRAANEIVRESGRMIGGVLAGLVNFYNPSAIFIGGGVSKIGNQLLSTIRQATLRRATALSTRTLRIEYSRLGDDAGVHGAIWLAMESVFEPAIS